MNVFPPPSIGVTPHQIVSTPPPPTSLPNKMQLDAKLSRITIYQAQPPAYLKCYHYQIRPRLLHVHTLGYVINIHHFKTGTRMVPVL